MVFNPRIAYFVSQNSLIILVCLACLGLVSGDVTINFGFGSLRSQSGQFLESGDLWIIVAAAPGESLPGGLSENSSIGEANISLVRADFGGSTITLGSKIGGSIIMAIGQVDLNGVVLQSVNWSDEDYQIIQSNGLIGLYWFPGINAGTAVLPKSGFAIGGMQEINTDPASGGDNGMTVPPNSGATLTIAYLDSDITGSSSSLPVERFTAIQVPPSGYQVWRDLEFTESQIEAGDGLPGADPDRDGSVNLLEYATGSPPLLAGPGPLDVDRQGAGVALRFKQIADPELRYRIEATEDLSVSPWPDVVFESEGVENVDDLIEISLPIHPGKRFFRLRVEFLDGAGF